MGLNDMIQHAPQNYWASPDVAHRSNNPSVQAWCFRVVSGPGYQAGPIMTTLTHGRNVFSIAPDEPGCFTVEHYHKPRIPACRAFHVPAQLTTTRRHAAAKSQMEPVENEKRPMFNTWQHPAAPLCYELSARRLSVVPM